MAGKIHRNSLKPGHKILWYEIKEILGQGGFGITYLAYDPNLKKNVAIKEYLPIELAVRERDHSVHPVSEERGEQYKWGLDRFIKEAQTLAQFDHPNIVRVHSVTEENNTAYMVMVYEHGQTLQEILKGKKTLEEAELLKILIPILGGLEQIHNAGFIHRDIKPDNIFIRTDGSPLLLDFGSARQALGEQTKTLTSLVSPGYSPFEQYFCKSDEQGEWTDIYGLGATLYRAIAGVAPQDAIDRSNAILKTSKDIIVTAIEIGKGKYSERFLKAIDYALNFKPEDRPQSIAEWINEFEPPASETVTIIPTDNRAEYKKQPISLKKRFVPLFLGAIVVIIVAFFISNQFLRDQTNEALPLEYTDSDSPKVIMAQNDPVGDDAIEVELAEEHLLTEEVENQQLATDIKRLKEEEQQRLSQKRKEEETVNIKLFSEHDDPRLRDAIKLYQLDRHQEAYTKINELADKDVLQAIVLKGWMIKNGHGIETDVEKGNEIMKRVIPKIEKLAYENNVIWAKCYLGIIYNLGLNGEINIDESLRLLTEAAEAGYSVSTVYLGQIYYGGLELPKDIEKGLSYIKEGASQGNTDAIYSIAKQYLSGDHLLKNEEKGLLLLNNLADIGHLKAEYDVATILFNDGNYENKNKRKIFDLYIDAAKYGNKESQLRVGQIYEAGWIVPVDKDQALSWYKKSAEQGKAEAMLNTARIILAKENKNNEDVTEGKKYLDSAIQLNYLPAFTYSGGIYYQDKKYDEALKQYLVAAKEDNLANQIIGLMYLYGYGMDIDIDKAMQWLQKAVSMGNKDAATYIATIYSDQGNVKYYDLNKSYEWYLIGANGGNSHAQNMVGYYLLNGIGTGKNHKEAAVWLVKAASNKSIFAYGNLGILFALGEGYERNLVKAYALLKYCTEKVEHPTAKDYLIKVKAEMTTKDLEEGEEFYNNLEKTLEGIL